MAFFSAGGAAHIDEETVPIAKMKEIFIAVHKPQDTMYTDQTRKSPHASSSGYNYQMIRHKIDGTST